MRIILIQLACVWLSTQIIAMPVWAEPTKIPVPHGVGELADPTRVDVGTGTLYVQSYLTRKDDEELIKFYEKVLPGIGWRRIKLPWQAGHDAVTKRIEKNLAFHKQELDSQQREDVEERLETFQKTQKDMRKQIYASRGREHVIVNLWPIEEGTMVFINRWSGDRRWIGGDYTQGGLSPQPVSSKPQVGSAPIKQKKEGFTSKLSENVVDESAESVTEQAALPSVMGGDIGGFPLTNVCCSGEEVPELEGALPFSVPKYPGAKAVARATPSGGVRTTVLLMAPDGTADVALYYREQMPSNGWKLLDEKKAPGEYGETTHWLTYQRSDRNCELTIVGTSLEETNSPDWAKSLITVAVKPRAFGRAQ